MDAGMEKECSALGGLFQTIMNDMKASYPAWEDFVTKGAKLQSQLRTTIIVTSSFLDAFQKVADIATGTRGATKEIGSALTRMCMRHRSIENKLKLFTAALMDNLIAPLELKIEEWKKVSSQLDKDHAKEYKKARSEIKKKSSDTIKLQKKVKKGKDEVRMQLDSALQDVNTRYAVLEETEKRAVCRALIEERGRFCSFVTMLKPVLDEEISMLGEVTHLQTILEDLGTLTTNPNILPPASEQVILDLKSSDYSYTYQTPPASPSNTLSRKSSISSTYTSVRHVPSLDSISSAVDGLHLRPPDITQRSRSPLLLPGGEEGARSHSSSPTVLRTARRGPHPRHRSTDQSGINSQPWQGPDGPGTENGTSMPPPHKVYGGHEERSRTLSTSSKPQTGRDQLTLGLGGGLNSEAPRTSRDSLHCSSGYSTQTTTPSCSEDTIPSQHDYDYISLHGGEDGHSQSDFDKSSTIPRNSDLSLNYRKMFQSKRPASTVSLLMDPEPIGPHTATIRRKPSSKPNIRRGTISGGVPIPISTPQVPLKASVSTAGLSGSEEAVCPTGVMQSNRLPGSDLAHTKHNLCTSTQSLSAMPPPYYSMFPGQPPVGGPDQIYQMSKQQQYALHQQQQRQYQQQCQQQQQNNPQQPQNNQQQQPQYRQPQQQYSQQPQQQYSQQPQQQYSQQPQQQYSQQPQQQYSQQPQQQYSQQPQQQYNQQHQQYKQQISQQQHYNQQQQFNHQQQHNQQQQHIQQQQQYNQQQQYQQPERQKELQLKFKQQKPQTHLSQQQQNQQQGPNATVHNSSVPTESGPPDLTQPAVNRSDSVPDPGSGGDMLSMIRRVKLRRTLTNDRSAPFITPNHLD
ncbi:protein MTSS 1 isoform X2 [Triplophysa dalaica]|uniref:protein MTSS 1 isoform X2 n=1 Tax=Triplophysa dalaica TaxID=1582913 RepID=UPI0024E01DFC|nr:protein MTSS 1 isoform X2 [Triplophysa dalaica]